MTAPSLVEFLHARIQEDEDVARANQFDPHWTARPDEPGQPIKAAGRARVATCAESVMAHIARHDPARVLAECEAKRRIVEIHHPLPDDPEPFCWNCDEESWPCKTMSALALPYADHPDYEPGWKP